MSNLINKAKDALSGNKPHGTIATSTSHHGPHSTGTINSIDSTATPGTEAGHRHHGTNASSGIGHGQHASSTAHHTNASSGIGHGPHTSSMANAVDPTINTSTGGSRTHHGTTGTTTSGHGLGQSAHGQTTVSGHSSNLANKLDPRIDSDGDHRNDPTSRVGGYGQTQDTYTGTRATSTGVGHGGASHTSGIAGSGTHTGGVMGSGAQSYGTTGASATESKRVHDSALLNKLDPATKTNSAGQPI